MAKRSTTELTFSAIRIEGSLLAADFLGRVARFEATGQAEADYDIPKGLKLRDEIGRYWKIALNTPDSLVQELIKSTLEPVIAQTLQANPQQPVNALLNLTVCDPACGSGHFLLAAARRIAEEVVRLNASEGNPLQSDYRHALREVVAHCIYGVDKNPMAVELAKTALWLEPTRRTAPSLSLTITCAVAMRCWGCSIRRYYNTAFPPKPSMPCPAMIKPWPRG